MAFSRTGGTSSGGKDYYGEGEGESDAPPGYWPEGELDIVGTDVKDSLNHLVYLRGVNRPSGFTVSCTGSWMRDGENPFDNDDSGCYTHWYDAGCNSRLQQMKDKGFNTVRLIFWLDWWMDDASTNLSSHATDVSMRWAMHRTAELAEAKDMVIVYSPYGICPDQLGMPYPNAYLADDEAFADFWSTFATAFLGHENVLFDLWNEPAPGDPADWWPGASKATTHIRAVTDRIVIPQIGYCAGMEWVAAQAIAWGNAAGNVLWSNHIYHTAGATIPPALTGYDEIKAHLLGFRDYDQVVGVYPFWIGEIGAWVLAGGTEEAYYMHTLEILNDWGIGYAGWEWDQPGTGWQLQNDSGTGAPYPVNSFGQILVDKIAES